jgi:heme/copper-type cytochrome/quinol oxidase subunit 3
LWDLANPDRPDPVVGTPADRVVAPARTKVCVLSFIVSEIGFFGILILTYLFYNATPQAGASAHDLNLRNTLCFSACLFASSFTMWRSEAALRRGNNGAMLRWLAATFILGAIFMGGQGYEYWDLGLLTMLILLGLGLAGDFKTGGATVLEAFGYYWHFVDGVWVFVLTSVYLLPLLR